jgi:hypothetical protein
MPGVRTHLICDAASGGTRLHPYAYAPRLCSYAFATARAFS